MGLAKSISKNIDDIAYTQVTIFQQNVQILKTIYAYNAICIIYAYMYTHTHTPMYKHIHKHLPAEGSFSIMKHLHIHIHKKEVYKFIIFYRKHA